MMIDQTRALKITAYSTVLLACAGVFGYAAVGALGTPTPDELGCYDEVSTPQTWVLVDASEPRWNENQQRGLQRYFKQAFEGLFFNERLAVFTSEGDQVADVLAPRFELCGSAQSPQDLAEIGGDTVTRGYLAKQIRRQFDRLLKPELEALLTLDPDETRRQNHQSPILELLASLSHRPGWNDVHRLVVASDLIQNTETSRFCYVQNAMPKFANFKNRPTYQRVAPQSYDGKSIEVLMLQRQGYATSALPHCYSEEEIRAFWRDYFEHHGAAAVRFTRLRIGMGGQ